MKFELYTDVALSSEVLEHRLRPADIVKLVDHHVAPDGTKGDSIEVFNALGDTIAVTSVPASALEALRQDEVLGAHVLRQAISQKFAGGRPRIAEPRGDQCHCQRSEPSELQMFL